MKNKLSIDFCNLMLLNACGAFAVAAVNFIDFR